MKLEALFLDNFASLHNLSHLIDRYHGDWIFFKDSTETLNDSFDMLRLVGFTVDDALANLGLENIEDVQWVAIVEVLDQFIGDLKD